MSLNLLKHLAQIERDTTRNSDGVVVHGWDSNGQGGIRCLLQENRGRVMVHETGQFLEYDAILFVHPNADLRPNNENDQPDRILMLSPSDKAGKRFMVSKVGDESGFTHHLTAYLKRLRS